MKVRFTIKKPDGKTRKTFSIRRDVVYAPVYAPVYGLVYGSAPKREQKTVHHPAIDALNKAYLDSLKTNRPMAIHDVYLQLREIVIPELQAKEGSFVRKRAILGDRFHEDNERLFNDLWETKYEGPRNRNRPQSNDTARLEFKKALQLVGPHPLASISEAMLWKHWKGLTLNDTQRRRYGTRINQLLRQANAAFDLPLPAKKKHPPLITHITLEEFLDLLPHVEDKRFPELSDLIATLFGTGCRWGEAFALNSPAALKPQNRLYIYEQMLEKKYGFAFAPLKNGVPHDTCVLPQFVSHFKRWAAVPVERKKEMRDAVERCLPQVSKRYFKDSLKQIGNHDIRHCYAIHMLSRAHLDVKTVAMLLGDSIDTVIRHYVQWVITDLHAEFVFQQVERIKLEQS